MRPVLKKFAEYMEVKLQENDHKDGWENCSNMYLLTKLMEEIGEVFNALDNEFSSEDIINECADAANILMMIADNNSF